MKTTLTAALLIFSLISCSEKETNPDLTQQYIGSWKTEVQRTTQQVYWTSYEIKRISNTMLTINAGERWESLLGEFDDYTDTYTLDSVEVNSDRSINIKSSRVLANGQNVSYNGSGQIVNNTLTIQMVVDYDNLGNDIPTVIKLAKQN